MLLKCLLLFLDFNFLWSAPIHPPFWHIIFLLVYLLIPSLPSLHICLTQTNRFICISANAAKEHMAPYFQQIVEMLKGYLTEDQTEETMTLQVQSIGMMFWFY